MNFNGDRAAVTATGVFQIIQLSSSPESARQQVEEYIRDEIADIERQRDDDARGDE